MRNGVDGTELSSLRVVGSLTWTVRPAGDAEDAVGFALFGRPGCVTLASLRSCSTIARPPSLRIRHMCQAPPRREPGAGGRSGGRRSGSGWVGR